MNQHSWLQKWSVRLLSVTGTQVLSQALNGIVAFALVRSLTKQEYAWFTIGSSMAAILSSLNDGGIATAVISNGGEVWNDRQKLASLVKAGLSLLKRTAVFSAIIVGPMLVWLLAGKQAPLWAIGLLLLVIIGPQWVATRTVILSSINRLHSRIGNLQIADLGAAFTRSALTLIPAAFGFINVHIAFLAVAISSFVQARIVTKQVSDTVSVTTDPADDQHFRKRITLTMRQMYPNNVFNCVQSQLATGLLSVFGTASQVADLGALNRLTFFSNFISAPLSYIIGPAFSRCQDPSRLITLFLSVLSAYSLILAAFLGLIVWQADAVLLLFGPKYAHLHDELFLVGVAIATGFINQVFWNLNFSRGWVRWVWLNIPMTMAGQIASAFLLDVASVAGAAKMAIATSIPAILLGAGIAFSELKNLRHKQLNR